jgi:hypothetical protein
MDESERSDVKIESASALLPIMEIEASINDIARLSVHAFI